MKSYKIRTTTDIYKAVTYENIDGFLKDFEAYLRMALIAKGASEPLGLGRAEAGFTWNDDNENGVLKGINIEIKPVTNTKK
jgi:hypothetical protein